MYSKGYRVNEQLPQKGENILRFMFIKQKVHPNGDMDKLKARLLADGRYDVDVSASLLELDNEFNRVG